jgi:hypothetical protein
MKSGTGDSAAAGLAANKGRSVNPMPTRSGRLRIFGYLLVPDKPIDPEPFAPYTDYVQVMAAQYAFAALRSNGSVIVQGGSPNEPQRTFVHTTPPVTKLTSSYFNHLWALTEDGHVVLLPPVGSNKLGPWQQMEGLVEFYSGDGRQYLAGRKADGQVVLTSTVAADWMPKAESLPKATAIHCDNYSLMILTQEGAVMAWHKSGVVAKVPQQLRRGIQGWMNPGVTVNPEGTEIQFTGYYLDRQGKLLKGSRSSDILVAENVEQLARHAWRPRKKPWVFTPQTVYGEVEQAAEVLSKGTPLSWSLESVNVGGTQPWKTGVFLWIE